LARIKVYSRSCQRGCLVIGYLLRRRAIRAAFDLLRLVLILRFRFGFFVSMWTGRMMLWYCRLNGIGSIIAIKFKADFKSSA